VLINSLNELKADGVSDIKKRIYLGTKQRLRPILLTAISAIMGFTPMALSTSAGAEVQRPLATVVIGGLITATLLTLIVIPILYYYTEKQISMKSKTSKKSFPLRSVGIGFILMGTGLFLPQKTVAQERVDGNDTLFIREVQQAEKIALANNPQIKVSRLKTQRQEHLQHTGFDLPKTEFYYGQE